MTTTPSPNTTTNTTTNNNDPIKDNDSKSKNKRRKPKKTSKKPALPVPTHQESSDGAAVPGSKSVTNLSKDSHRSLKKSTSSHRSWISNSKKSQKAKKQPSLLKQHGMIQLPHVKMTIRNLQGVDKFGSVQGVVDFLREFFRDRNQKKNDLVNLMGEESVMISKIVTPCDVVLDEKNVTWILTKGQPKQEDDVVNETLVWDGNKDESGPSSLVPEHTKSTAATTNIDGAAAVAADSGGDGNENETRESATTCTNLSKSVVSTGSVSLSQDASSSTVISAKILYIVPAKKSSRRGELPGHCYVILYPPIPNFYQEKLNSILLEREVRNSSKPKTVILPKQQVEETSVASGESKGGDVAMEKDNDMQKVTTQEETTVEKDISKRTAAVTAITSSDKTKALAQSRLLLSETINSLALFCRDQSKKDRKYNGIQVEMSPNQKIWKTEDRMGDGFGGRYGKKFVIAHKYESTLEQNDDFVKFKNAKKQKEEELANRPKPPPGGGPVGDSTIIGESHENTTSIDNGSRLVGTNASGGKEAIAAIVLHLREKKAAAKKAKKKKDTSSMKKGKAAASSGSSEKAAGKNSKKGGGDDGDRKKKSKSRKKKAKQGSVTSNVKNAAKAPPKMVLKK